MTENKRFRMTETELIFMVLDNEKALSRKEIVDTLNQLYEENKELKQDLRQIQDSLWTTEHIKKLEKENERLKANYNSLSHNNGLLYDECSNKINALKKENEQLKKENKKLKSINNQLEDRLEESGIGIALKMEGFE